MAAMRYQLWDQEHGDMIADFNDVADALVAVRDEVATRGADAALTLALLRVSNDRAALEPVAQGEALLDLSRLPLATG